MQHLLCLTPDDFKHFVDITEMTILAAVPEQVTLQGEKIFTYVWDFTKEAYCLIDGVKS